MSSLEAVILSLSEELIAELDRARMGRNRSRSEIVAEALCWYFQSTTVETPTMRRWRQSKGEAPRSSGRLRELRAAPP